MKKLTILAALVLALPAASFADVFQVTMDTAGWTGSTGAIDIQFNAGSCCMPSTPFELGSATLRNFSILGGSLGALLVDDDVSLGGSTTGTLPGPMTITNGNFINGPVYGATFGSKITFEVEFLGLAFTAPGQTNLSSLFVVIGATPGTFRTQIDLLGESKIGTAQSSQGVQVSPVGAIPEPSTYLLVSGALGAGFLIRRRRRR
jgi:hypothetical protein